MIIVCAWCKKKSNKPPGAVNRAAKIGAPLYCDRKCAGFGRRDPNPPTKAEKIVAKAKYDAEYRRKNRALLKEKKRAYFQRTYDPVKAAIDRQKTMARHVEYCRRPEYRAWKRDYDKKYRASEYGPFAEAYMLLLDLDREVNSRMTDYEVRLANGTINKRQKRKRQYESFASTKITLGC